MGLIEATGLVEARELVEAMGLVAVIGPSISGNRTISTTELTPVLYRPKLLLRVRQPLRSRLRHQ
jgi:hypothetical protein